MFKKTKILLSIAAIAWVITSANSALAEESSSMAKDNLKNSTCTSTDFSLKLFEHLAPQSKGNLVISPFSAYAALSMALNGAAGSTSTQMAKAMGTSNDKINSLNERNKSILSSLTNNNDKVKLEIGNAIFSDTNTPFKTTFLKLCQQKYDAEIKNVSFADNSTVNGINTWCKTKTHGKIPTIVSKLSRSEKMVILNAIYFKGTWAKPFQKSLTQDEQFTTLTGEKTSTRMMHQLEHLAYFENTSFQAVAIPYKSNRQSLYIFLPNRKIKWPLFLAEFTQTNWDKWMSNFSNEKVDLSLPKFTVEFSQDLSAGLESIGMKEAFDSERANFSNMIKPPAKAWISRVLQRTYMDVNEQGTEAAAATAVIMGATMSVALKPPIEFHADHPFILALIDNDSKEILFLGSIVKP